MAGSVFRGVPAIAHQNRHLIELLNSIIDTLEAGGETEPILDFRGEVNAGISAHFGLEEQIMRDQHYDQYPDHKTGHERLLDDIREIMDGLADDSYADRRDALALRRTIGLSGIPGRAAAQTPARLTSPSAWKRRFLTSNPDAASLPCRLPVTLFEWRAVCATAPSPP